MLDSHLVSFFASADSCSPLCFFAGIFIDNEDIFFVHSCFIDFKTSFLIIDLYVPGMPFGQQMEMDVYSLQWFWAK